jgi:L,D-transpeptidase catalytic domain
MRKMNKFPICCLNSEPEPERPRQSLTRRQLFGGLVSAGALSLSRKAFAEPTLAAIDSLQPGQFSWHPEKAPVGHLVIVVSLPDQRLYAYRQGVRVAVSTCSTGKAGHRTPTGVFSILQKDKHHRSSTYNDAPMPNMNRLTWAGVALHAGELPGYPASHGCVRLPLEFSEKLFGITEIGTPVIIANAATYPSVVAHPGMILAKNKQRAAHALKAKQKTAQQRKPLKHPNSAVVISGVDKEIIVMDDGVLVAKGAMSFSEPDRPLGNHVFILSSINLANKELQWRTIGYYNDSHREIELTELATLQRIHADEAILNEIRSRMYPGTVLVTVDEPLSADTRSSKDFIIMTTGDDA